MRFLFIALGCVLITGCSRSGLHPVTGVVLLDGQPVANAALQFVPQEAGQDATGATDAQGNFAISTNEPRDGVKAGKYKVVITPRSTAPLQKFASADEAMKAAARPQPPPPSTFPQKYTRPDQTPLLVEVPMKEKSVRLELTSN
ncbi:carboxypeptidase-like regulatory domain-containing protein [Anatilimnocola floriformis]|uniref:carboxypeptidase-like regulatory domain-containing protein n=1 Tax=Anatilimnocola floriformis TaxID=2948575 RepID=UPI0020C5A4A2|nr:carboxypeptidase-like regulatory domain-containing protein [Anatilimnocola floriformis]